MRLRATCFSTLGFALSGLLQAVGASPLFADQTSTRLNVVFILADDLGWSDATLYGTTKFHRTPNIQRLAERGMTFTRAYGREHG